MRLGDSAAIGPAAPRGTDDEVWFDRPANGWLEALPLGNGRMGVMAHGGVDVEHLQVNDATAWSGSPASERTGTLVDAAAAAAAIRAARDAVAAEDFDEAGRQVMRLQHRHSQSYLPFIDLRIGSAVTGVVPGEVTEYRRSLDLASASYSCTYRVDGHEVRRRVFLSHPHGVGVVTISADCPAGLDLTIALGSLLRVTGSGATPGGAWMTLRLPADVWPTHDELGEPARYSDEPGTSLDGAVALSWTHDGHPGTTGISATGVHEATIVFSTRTTFAGIARPPRGSGPEALAQARERVSMALADGIDSVRRSQQADHAALYDRVRISTGPAPTVDLPIDARLRRGNANANGVLRLDPALAGLLYNFGRYLLISSSRAGGVPANLQGIWNNLLQPPWSSNYTTNINLEMNYWPAEVANLSELATPLFDLIDGLTVTGAETARRVYGAPGWVAHHNTDPWAYSQPAGNGRGDPRWGFWPLAGAWLVRHLWEHLLFGADDDFARRALPPIRSAAEFFLYWLVELPDGSLGTSPSTSPENGFVQAGDGDGTVDASSTLDLVLIADVFRILGAVADRLGIDDDQVVQRAAAALTRIPGPVPGRDGMIPEWRADRPQCEPGHRHLSHLYFAFPGDLPLTLRLRAAVNASMDGRGDDATGWSLAWKVALRARLRQPHRVSDLLKLVFRDIEVDPGGGGGGLYPNLFAAHPPFQVDGNLGFVAAFTECLMQSHAGVIELLPAVPPELSIGSVAGIVARPGIEVSIRWEPDAAGEITLAEATFSAVSAPGHARLRVVWNGREVWIDLSRCAAITLRGNDFTS
jgi:alpha-L-fucosidase 2